MTTVAPISTTTVHLEDGILIGMTASYVGIIIISGLLLHLLYHFRYDSEKNMPLRMKCSYMLAFLSYLVSCFAFGFLRMSVSGGWEIPCSIGYLIPFLCYLTSRMLVFLILVLRIDTTIGVSAFAYPRRVLVAIATPYILIQLTSMVVMIVITIQGTLVHFKDPHFDITWCSIEFDGGGYIYIYVIISGIIDCILQISLSYLFVRKLQQLRNLVDDSYQRDDANSHKIDKLTRLMYKQTILVLIEVAVSSTLQLGQIVYIHASTLAPIGFTISVICVWFMFRFTDKIWDTIIPICCGCLSHSHILQKHPRKSLQDTITTHSEVQTPTKAVIQNNIPERSP